MFWRGPNPRIRLSPTYKHSCAYDTAAIASLSNTVTDIPKSLVDSVASELNGTLSKVSDSLNSLKSLVDTAQALKNELSSSVESVVTRLSSKSTPSLSTTTNRQPRPMVQKDRSQNLILFGLPECSLEDTKCEVDKVLAYLAGRAVPWHDAFRLGKRKNGSAESNGSESTFQSSNTPKPRPLLIKVSNIWDRRLILSKKRTLKDYEVSRLFIREDFPPNSRPVKKISASTTDKQVQSSAPVLNASGASSSSENDSSH